MGVGPQGGPQGTLRANDAEARTVAERWEEFTQYLGLGLSQDLGRSVIAPRPRNQTTSERLDQSVKDLAADGTLTAVLRVPTLLATCASAPTCGLDAPSPA